MQHNDSIFVYLLEATSLIISVSVLMVLLLKSLGNMFYFSVKGHLGFPCGLAGKESACNVGDLGFIPGLGRFPGEGKGYPLQYSGLENSMDCIVHGVAKSYLL